MAVRTEPNKQGAGSGLGWLLAAVLLCMPVVLAACGDSTRTYNRLDGPTDVALLEPGLFFEVPVAFVSNFRSGRVSKLDLKRSNLLVEDSPAPWMQSPDVALGADRAGAARRHPDGGLFRPMMNAVHKGNR